MKRVLDIALSSVILLLASPTLLIVLLLVWLQDGHDPIYRARRVGRGGAEFTMLKIRSMIADADRNGVNSTGVTDRRITRLGRFIRKYKIDELSQFVNVLAGEMSVVGPRPNTRVWGVELYTTEERRLLEIRPGITDLASIVFSDEGEILAGAEHADLRYNQLIRPWKSRLGLVYRDNLSISLDLRIVWLTVIAMANKPRALRGVTAILEHLEVDPELIATCRREEPLQCAIPPGAGEVFELS